jgi:meso-butanediol dehydrogenase/(S,S)-butanediol dehydrogenase/diacetyl reductase
MDNRMAGRIALITGGAGGIGAAAGELFCTHGGKVLLADRDAAALAHMAQAIRERVPGAEIEVCAADVTRPEDAARAVRQAVASFGALNVLVNNAAVRYLSPIAEADTAKWNEVLQVNLLGAVNLCQAALPELRKQADASVVNVASTYGVVGRAQFGAYDASKAALISLTRTLAFEEAGHGVRVNAVCPGGTLTPFTVGRGAARGRSEDQLRAEAKADSLLKRWAEEKEVAYPIMWLASTEASFITGASLMVDGGTSIM